MIFINITDVARGFANVGTLLIGAAIVFAALSPVLAVYLFWGTSFAWVGVLNALGVLGTVYLWRKGRRWRAALLYAALFFPVAYAALGLKDQHEISFAEYTKAVQVIELMGDGGILDYPSDEMYEAIARLRDRGELSSLGYNGSIEDWKREHLSRGTEVFSKPARYRGRVNRFALPGSDDAVGEVLAVYTPMEARYGDWLGFLNLCIRGPNGRSGRQAVLRECRNARSVETSFGVDLGAYVTRLRGAFVQRCDEFCVQFDKRFPEWGIRRI